MFQSCALVIVMSLVLAGQWLVVLFYSKLKFKHRYTYATILSFLTTSVALYLVFNCSQIINNDPALDDVPKNKLLFRHVRNIKPEVRELLEENDRFSHHTVHLKNDDIAYHYGNEGGEIQGSQSREKMAIEDVEELENMQKEYEQIIEGERETTYQTTDQNAGEETENDIEDDLPTSEEVIDDKSKNNLMHNIYNNMSETVITLNEYLQIAQHNSFKHDDMTTPIPDDVINKGLEDWNLISEKLPLSPDETLHRFGSFLPWWEQLEILSYPEIYYIGIGAKKIPFVNSVKGNFGYDYPPDDEDNAGVYKTVVGDHIAYRYEILMFLGSGSYGSVLKTFDHKTKEYVAIKFMMNEKDWDDRYIRREMSMILKIENESPRKTYFPIVHSHFMFRNHKCIVMELLGESIHRRHRNSQPVRDMNLIKRFTRDILNGVVDLHQMNIIHGDLKPDNIMFMPGKNNHSKGDQLLKVADFGLACLRDSKTFKCPSYYIQTRYYRSPEVIMALPYNTSADMWSVGVIVAEMYNGNPMFWGETETDQLASMMEVLGLLPPFMVEQSSRRNVYQDAVCFTTKNGFKRLPYRKPLNKVALYNAPSDFADFIKRCLTYDANLRLTAKEALNHPFITS